VLQDPGTRRVVGTLKAESGRILAALFVERHARLLGLGDALELRELLPLGQHLALRHLQFQVEDEPNTFHYQSSKHKFKHTGFSRGSVVIALGSEDSI
jgi:hypothetical protein